MHAAKWRSSRIQFGEREVAYIYKGLQELRSRISKILSFWTVQARAWIEWHIEFCGRHRWVAESLCWRAAADRSRLNERERQDRRRWPNEFVRTRKGFRKCVPIGNFFQLAQLAPLIHPLKSPGQFHLLTTENAVRTYAVAWIALPNLSTDLGRSRRLRSRTDEVTLNFPRLQRLRINANSLRT